MGDAGEWQAAPAGDESVAAGTIPASQITAAEWNFQVGDGAVLSEKLRRMPAKLGDVADVFVGLQTSALTTCTFLRTIADEDETIMYIVGQKQQSGTLV